MNLKLSAYTILAIAFLSMPAMAQKGFTTKAAAKNAMKNGAKDGNWLEYIDNTGKATTDTNAAYYVLTVYKAGKKNGLANEYSKKGIQLSSIPYKNDLINGAAKYYYSDGKLEGETTFKNNNMYGLQKVYYESGKEKSETTWTNGKSGATKSFDETGKQL
jgi:hypothetical protein